MSVIVVATPAQRTTRAEIGIVRSAKHLRKNVGSTRDTNVSYQFDTSMSSSPCRASFIR
jgi:hypothetical protein